MKIVTLESGWSLNRILTNDFLSPHSYSGKQPLVVLRSRAETLMGCDLQVLQLDCLIYSRSGCAEMRIVSFYFNTFYNFLPFTLHFYYSSPHSPFTFDFRGFEKTLQPSHLKWAHKFSQRHLKNWFQPSFDEISSTLLVGLGLLRHIRYNHLLDYNFLPYLLSTGSSRLYTFCKHGHIHW